MDFVLLNGSKSADVTREFLPSRSNLKNDLSKEFPAAAKEEDDNEAYNQPISTDPSNVRPKRRHQLFRSYEEEEDFFLGRKTSETGSTASFLAHMNTPSPSDIQEWMADTQDTVGKVVTNWQQDIIDSSSKITELLTHLIQFVTELEDISSTSPIEPVYILSAKLINNQGTFESVINVYLHLILISLRQVAAHSSSKMENHEDPETEHRKKKNKRRSFDRHHNKLLIDILGQFAMVAEDALNFLEAHIKILGPACERILEMRNSLYYFLRQVVTEPTGQIIPLVSNVKLEGIREREDFFWLQRLCHEHKMKERCMGNYLEISVGSKDCKFVKMKEGETIGGAEEDMGDKQGGITESVELSVDERLELIKLLLKQLGTSLGSSNKACRSNQGKFSDLQGRLMRKFQKLVRNLEVEKKHDKLKAENCCEHLKASLCQLEVKFHQVERIYEEIPQHLRRVIGVADYCSRQLMQDFGLEEELELEERSSWSSPIEEISVEFFKGGRRGFVIGCFPYIWRIIVKVLAGNMGGGAGRRLKQFWEEVRSEMEDFRKEIKMKELEEEYGVVLRVPVHFKEKDEEDVVLSVLSKYK